MWFGSDTVGREEQANSDGQPNPLKSGLPKRFRDLPASLLARSVGGALLLLIIPAVVGIPLPSFKPIVTDEVFPCMDCPCGCRTADFCWDRCCCFSDSEKIAWAAQRGVTPPAFLLARHAASTLSLRPDAPREPSCCSSGKCCATKGAGSAPSCCSSEGPPSRQAARDDDPFDGTSEEEARQGSSLIQLQALASCRGVDLFWSLLGQSWVVSAPRFPRDLNVIDRRVPHDLTAESVRTAIEPPVPWRSCQV